MTKNLDDIRAGIDAENRKHDQLLAELEVPEYSGRRLQAQWVKSKSAGAITGTTGWTASAPAEVLELLEVGDPFVLETKGFNEISGWLIKGRWYARKSDQDLKRSRDDYLESARRRDEEYVAAHRAEWTVREAALPEWIAQRIRYFRETNPTFQSEPMGWGYELIICELAVLYADMGAEILDKTSFNIDDSDAVTAFAEKNGTSGMQHHAGLAFAQQHLTTEADKA